MNNFSNIPEEFLVKHGNNNNRRSNSTVNNKNINNKQYERLLKRVKNKSQVNIKKELEKAYKERIDQIKRTAKKSELNKEQTAALFEKFIKNFREIVKRCHGAVKSIEASLKHVDFEGLNFADALDLSSKYSFDNPDPELFISRADKNSFDSITDRIMYIIFRKDKATLDAEIEGFVKSDPDYNDKNGIKKWADKWPDYVKYWQYWVKLIKELLSKNVNLEKYKVYQNIHKLEMNEYDFIRVNSKIEARDIPFNGVQSKKDLDGLGRRDDLSGKRDGRSKKSDDSGERKGRDKKKRGRRQRGGDKCSKQEMEKVMKLQFKPSYELTKREKQLIKKCSGSYSRIQNSKTKKGGNMTDNMMRLFRILAGTTKDEGYNSILSNEDILKSGSIWNMICQKMRQVIYKKLGNSIDNFDGISWDNGFITATVKNNSGKDFDIWPFKLANIDLYTLLNNALKGDKKETTIKTNIIKSIKGDKFITDKLLNKENQITTYLFTNFFEKNSGAGAGAVAGAGAGADTYHKYYSTLNPYITITNPFTGIKYNFKDKFSQFGGSEHDRLNKYIKFFNIFSINFIGDRDPKFEKIYNDTKNNIFVGLLEYYHRAASVIENTIKQLCYEYSISEKKICNSSSNSNNKKEGKNDKKKKDEKREDKKRNNNNNSNNKKKTVKKVKSLLNNNNNSKNNKNNKNSGLNEKINNAKIIVSINDQIKSMIKKAQNDENYNYMNKITDFLEEHRDKLKEMDYANAVKLLNNIRE